MAHSEDRLDDLLTCARGVIFSQSKFFRSRKVYYRNSGTIDIDGRLYFGFLSNRLGLDPNARGVLRIYKQGHLRTSGLVRIARSCKVYVAGSLTIGSDTYINPGTMLFARTSVSIGSQCAISWNCEIIDDDFHRVVEAEGADTDASDGPDNCTAAPIQIGDRVWIGSHCSILKGVTIGDGAIIGSRSVVTRDIPAHSLAVGCPAKVIKTGMSWK